MIASFGFQNFATEITPDFGLSYKKLSTTSRAVL
nr:unnamed protein product [Callosobruchus analis]